ncbi:DUF1073 domain-containing protein [Escherichia coli]|nr:DUF1073 domain-containing protein [Escherichia coli]
MTEDEMKAQRAANASLEKDRRKHLSAIFNGTSNTKRHRIYQEFGYPRHLSFDDFYQAYRRNAVAGAAVERMCEGCWEDLPVIWEGEKEQKARQPTAWDKRVNKLLKRCWKQIKGADKRNLVGRYAGLMIQFKDSLTWDQPVNRAVVANLAEKAMVKLIPVWEAQLDPVEWDDNDQSETFGEVKMYSFTELPVGGDSSQRPSRIVRVHPERIIILAEGADDGDMNSGISLLEAGFNKLLDIEKVSGGASEGFLKNASRQLNYSFSEKTNFAQLAKALGVPEGQLADALDAQVRRMNDSTDSASFMQAGTAEVLSVTPADPEPTWRTALNEFAATVPIPVKVLVGMQTGERASTEDAKDWAKTRNGRREGFLTDFLTELLTRFWTFGVIPPPAGEEVTVEWTDLLAPSDAEKFANMTSLANVAKSSMEAFGRSAISENEIRAAGQLEPQPGMDDFEPEEPPEPQPDPLAGDNGDATGQPAKPEDQSAPPAAKRS